MTNELVIENRACNTCQYSLHNKMPKAHIQTPDGSKITIEGGAAEIASIVKQIQSPTSNSKPARRITRAAHEKRDRKKQQSASDRIANLKEEGFFNQPKRLSAVAAELEKSGYLYPVTTLSGVMLGLVQRRILTRVKKDGIWAYGKR
jgi:hypothetical protein